MALMITGATGGLGQLLLPHLSNLFSTTTIHALSRKPPSPSPYPNVVYHRGDFGDKDSLLAAFSGIKTLLLISTNEFDPSKRTPDQFRAVDAAKEAGVEWILYTSLALIEGMTVMESHVETEKYIKQIGLKYTSLRMGCYTDAFPIFLNWSDPSTTHIKLPGDGPVSFISRAELGEAVAHILHEIQTSPSTAEEKFANKTIYLRGPEALTMVDVAKVIGDTIGTEIKVEIVGEEEYLDWFVKNTGRSEFLAKAWGLGTYPLLSKGDAGKVDDGTTERALGRKPVRASEFIRKTLEQNREYKWHQWG